MKEMIAMVPDKSRELVRCGFCRYFTKKNLGSYSTGIVTGTGCTRSGFIKMNPNDFCSRGEKNINAEESILNKALKELDEL